jgi:dTDP-4-amino-4,6-dideoxygalactose transaminase
VSAQDFVHRCDLRAHYLAHKEEILDAIHVTLESGRYTLADQVQAFEQEYAEYLGIRHAVGVASGTDGLILALKALGVGTGDEVVTTPYTAIPTVSAIVAAGATPVFADIDPETYLVDVEQMAAAITSRTRAVMPVHIFGSVVDIPHLRRRLPPRVRIVEDAAQAHGSTLRGRKAGTFADVGVFSFYPTKNLGGYGDGGAIVTEDAELAGRVRLLRTYGMTDKDHIVDHGVNSRLDELQAAILRVKLRHLDRMNASRRRLAQRYYDEVRGGLLRYQVVPDGVVTNHHILAARVPGRRDALIAWLSRHGIQSNVYYLVPLHLQQANRHLGYVPGSLPNVEAVCAEAIALPMYAELPDTTLSRVVECVNAFATH